MKTQTNQTTYANKTKFVGDDDVKVMIELMHTLPFSIKKQRINNSEIIKKFGSTKIQVKPNDVVNIYDIKILLSIFKFFQDNEAKIVVTNIPVNDGKVKPVFTITNIDLISFIKRYTTVKIENKNEIINSIKRLVNYTIFKETYDEKNQKTAESTIRFLYDFEIIDNRIVSFSILKKVYQRIIAGLTLKIDTLFRIKGNISSALYIFLISQNHTTFKETTLIEILGLSINDKKHSRAYLKEAFIELKKIGFLSYDDLIYEKNSEKYYRFYYLNQLTEQQAEAELE